MDRVSGGESCNRMTKRGSSYGSLSGPARKRVSSDDVDIQVDRFFVPKVIRREYRVRPRPLQAPGPPAAWTRRRMTSRRASGGPCA